MIDRPRPAGKDANDSGTLEIHLATDDELRDWDARAVSGVGGHVYQSRAWADYRATQGWRAWHIVFRDAVPLLALSRRWPMIPGAGAYAARGPLPAADAALTAQRAAAASKFLGGRGIDAIAMDSEMPAESGYGRLLELQGFRPIEELQPSRHRMDLDLPSGRGEDEVFGSFGTTTRQLIRTAERRGLRTVLLDPGSTWPLEQPFESASVDEGTAPEALLQAFYVMLQGTARRVGFGVAPRDQFLDWSSRALAAGHMLYLQAVDEEDEIVAGATFYRHGERLTYALAGDRADLRRKHPGAVRLLLWRGIQLALREGRRTVDLGGVDVRGARDKPEPGDATHGLLGFKQSFGAHWVELAGAHERVVNPVRYAAGRVAARLARVGR